MPLFIPPQLGPSPRSACVAKRDSLAPTQSNHHAVSKWGDSTTGRDLAQAQQTFNAQSEPFQCLLPTDRPAVWQCLTYMGVWSHDSIHYYDRPLEPHFYSEHTAIVENISTRDEHLIKLEASAMSTFTTLEPAIEGMANASAETTSRQSCYITAKAEKTKYARRQSRFFPRGRRAGTPDSVTDGAEGDCRSKTV